MTPAQVAAALDRIREVSQDPRASVELRNVALLAGAAFYEREQACQAARDAIAQLPRCTLRDTPETIAADRVLRAALAQADQPASAVDHVFYQAPLGCTPHMGLLLASRGASVPALRVAADEVPYVS